MARRTTRPATGNPTKNSANPATFAAGAEDIGSESPGDRAALDTRSSSMASEPSEEDIRMRAYRRYLERGGGDGRDFDDWLEAERELKNFQGSQRRGN